MCNGTDDLRYGFTIYALISPATHMPFYVGRSLDVEQRYVAHILSPQTAAMAVIIRELKAHGFRPQIAYLATAVQGCVENWWIKKLTLMGVPLVNRLYPKTCRLVNDWATRQWMLHGKVEPDRKTCENEMAHLLHGAFHPPWDWITQYRASIDLQSKWAADLLEAFDNDGRNPQATGDPQVPHPGSHDHDRHRQSSY